MSGTEKGSGTTKTPADFLKSIRGRPVVVKLNSGVDYRGLSLICHFCSVLPIPSYMHFQDSLVCFFYICMLGHFSIESTGIVLM